MRSVDQDQLRQEITRRAGPSPLVVSSGNVAAPLSALRTLDAALAEYRLLMLNAPVGVPDRPGVQHLTPFVGPGVRHSPRLRYIPARLSLVPALFRRVLVPDVVVLHTTVPRSGRLSLGIEVNVLPAALAATRRRGGLVIAAVDRAMPWTFGDAELDLELIDLAVEVDDLRPLPTHVGASDETAASIGRQVAGLVPEGATLQVGIGAVPDAVLAALERHRGLRVWSEMVSDGVLALERAGALDPDAILTTSFAFGSEELLAWLDRNPRVLFRRTEVVNDPSVIATQPAMTSINTALQIDLLDQANATWVGKRVHSGLGGQSDFVVGALHSPGGAAVLALASWHAKAGCSTIVDRLDGPVTSFQHSFVVSEQGTAALEGRTAQEQASALIHQVAHPSARDALGQRAVDLGLSEEPDQAT